MSLSAHPEVLTFDFLPPGDDPRSLKRDVGAGSLARGANCPRRLKDLRLQYEPPIVGLRAKPALSLSKGAPAFFNGLLNPKKGRQP